MTKHSYRSALRIISAAAGLGFAAIMALGQAAPQGNPPAAAGAAAAKLTPYSTPDKSASAGVPDGWKVTMGANSVINLSGPNGENIGLGDGIFVKNGPYQPGPRATGTIAMTMPVNATLQQKYAMLWQTATYGTAQPANVQILSATGVPLAKKIADCGKFLGTMNGPQGPVKFETAFCSLPLDTGGIYKLVWKSASLPASVATQERATAEAVMASYRVAPESLKLILAPFTAPPMAMSMPSGGGGGGMGMAPGGYGDVTQQQEFNCWDESILRDEPDWQLPRYCH